MMMMKCVRVQLVTSEWRQQIKMASTKELRAVSILGMIGTIKFRALFLPACYPKP
jgi:hypothetical protein